mmetsp:Transcript_19885/g.59436  ORF Transcript_19885/g.59436 Transcript_19885/m.59436 type:complete len:207 (+) Transcript_19885:132-752(+)
MCSGMHRHWTTQQPRIVRAVLRLKGALQRPVTPQHDGGGGVRRHGRRESHSREVAEECSTGEEIGGGAPRWTLQVDLTPPHRHVPGGVAPVQQHNSDRAVVQGPRKALLRRWGAPGAEEDGRWVSGRVLVHRKQPSVPEQCQALGVALLERAEVGRHDELRSENRPHRKRGLVLLKGHAIAGSLAATKVARLQHVGVLPEARAGPR